MEKPLLERIARALCPQDHHEAAGAKPIWEDYLPGARAVLLAIREPSAGFISGYHGPRGEAEYGLIKHHREFVSTAWRAMIDAALAEAPSI